MVGFLRQNKHNVFRYLSGFFVGDIMKISETINFSTYILKIVKTTLFMTFIILTSCSTPLGDFIKPINKEAAVKKAKVDKTVEINGNKKSESEATQPIVKSEVEPEKKTETPPVIKKVVNNTAKVNQYCEKIDRYFAKYKWGKSGCENYQWNHVRDSYWGNPIIWHVIGDEEEHKKKAKNVTMLLCGIHGDEITPVKFCFDVLHDLLINPQYVGDDSLVVIAPLVTPDSFLKKYPTRYNARGIDINRNFPTKDWNKNALKLWKSRYKSDKRRFPGNKGFSEQETVFMVNLIRRYSPDKIIQVHAPLTLIDYDGPEEDGNGNNATQLLIQMSEKAGQYRINNYPFFTGSLGNWAGNERKIPTYTLELPNSDWTKTKKFFNTFKTAIRHAIEHDLRSDLEPKKKVGKKSQKNDKVL